MVEKNSTVILQLTIKRLTNLYNYTLKDTVFGNGGMQEKNFKIINSMTLEGEKSVAKDLI